MLGVNERRLSGGCRAPFIASLLATVMNFCLDMVFMFGMGLGPAGAALATAVSQYMTLFVLVRIMLRTGMLQAGDIVKKQTLSHLPRLLVVRPRVDSYNKNARRSGLCSQLVHNAWLAFLLVALGVPDGFSACPGGGKLNVEKHLRHGYFCSIESAHCPVRANRHGRIRSWKAGVDRQCTILHSA